MCARPFGFCRRASRVGSPSSSRKANGIKLRDLIVSAKRAFVSEVFSILQPANWLEEVGHAYGIDLRSREPEMPAVHISRTPEP